MHPLLPRPMLLAACIGLLMITTQAAVAQYKLTSLDSNQVGKASHDDPLIVNAWGLVHGPGTPWWVADNNSGWSTLYDAAGVQNQNVKVLIPTAGENGPGSPTGVVFNPTNNFQVEGWPAIFLFATLDGTISGWAPQSNFNAAIPAVNNAKAGSVYTGLAISAAGDKLYAADIANNKVDMFDGTFKMTSFTDPVIPAGFAPFGIQDINGLVYVTFASVTGGSGGFVDVFKEDGKRARMSSNPLINGSHLNQPWGIALAPGNFGPLSHTLLISNNTNEGVINGFNPSTGTFVGIVKDATGKPIFIDQLWGIGFGGGDSKSGPTNRLYFAAGPHGNVVGEFGSIGFNQP